MIGDAFKMTEHLPWIPNPGPQTDLLFSAADIALFGGQAGGGKSESLLGLAMTQHKRSLIMRRHYTDLGALTEEAIRLNGTRDGFNGSSPPKLRTKDDRLIDFGAAQHAGSEEHWQGQPHDLLGLDEACQFLESQVRFLMGWVRSTEPGQRCRVVMASNPPVTADGQWIIGMFRPWLDITHPNPAKPGELRWYVTATDGKDLEVPDSSPVTLDGKTLVPQSRTFIPATLADNPYLIKTGYQARLDALPEPLRSAVRDGNFMAAREDADSQVIPTAWVIAAENRWKESGCIGLSMTAMALDPAGGGNDAAVLAMRYGGWYAPLISVTGPETADGSSMAALVTKHRRSDCGVVVDVGGGYGGGVTLRLKDNGIERIGFNGASSSGAKTRDGQLSFYNKRAEAWWRFREELDPDQEGGSAIAIPPDPELRADLTAPTWELTTRGIKIESKDDLRERLGRSPGKGDACVMCLSEGNRAAVKARSAHRHSGNGPRVVMGHSAARRAIGR